MIAIIWPEDSPGEVQPERWQRLLAVWHDQIKPNLSGAIALNFVDTDEIQELNRVHAKKDAPTDVLSFRYNPPLQDEAGQLVAGEIVICPAVAEAFARRHNLSLKDEYATLFVHGLLHLAGWDHALPTERDRYAEATRAIMEQGNYQAVSVWLD